jgi:hypothetical protein
MNLDAAAVMVTSVPVWSNTLSHVELSMLACRVKLAAVHVAGMSMPMSVKPDKLTAPDRDAPLSIVTVVVVGIPRPVGTIELFIGIVSLLSFCTLLPTPEPM